MAEYLSRTLYIVNSNLDGETSMTRNRMIGWAAFGVCILGYGAFAALAVMTKMDLIGTREFLLIGVPAAIVGEIGLWASAAYLGWNLFKGRKALFDRLFRRNAPAA